MGKRGSENASFEGIAICDKGAWHEELYTFAHELLFRTYFGMGLFAFGPRRVEISSSFKMAPLL